MFESLNDYYEFVENDKKLDDTLFISNKLKTLLESTKGEELKTKISYEIFFSDFSFEKGEFIPRMSYKGGEQYPAISLFGDFEYIKSRADSKKLKNPKYIAKYNHLLWVSPHKHKKYAGKAIDSYLKFLTDSKPVLDKLSVHYGFTKIYENLFVLCQKINYKKGEILSFTLDIVENSDLKGFQKYKLMELVSNEGKKNDAEYLESFFDFSLRTINNFVYPDLTKEYLELLITLANRLGKPTNNFYNLLGDYYVEESTKHKENFVAHTFYFNAVKSYKKAGNKAKVEEITVLMEKTKNKLNFKTIKVEEKNPMIKVLFDSYDEITTKLIEEYKSNEIYRYVITSDNIFPKSESLENFSKSVFMDLCSTTSFDINKNISKTVNTGINQYYIHILNFSIYFLSLLFRKGISKGKLNYKSIIDYLTNYSWYAKEEIIIDSDDDGQTYTWLELLQPALYSFFETSEIELNTNKTVLNGYVLSIDSLTLKFEGVLRAFSKKIGAQTIEVKDDGTQERISFDKLLENEKLTSLIPEDDIALFKFIFTSKGLNLRNNIAHCFFTTNNYSTVYIWLVITAFLKLGNYSFN